MIAFKLIRVLIYKGKNDTVIHIRSLGKISFLSLFVVPFFRNIKNLQNMLGAGTIKTISIFLIEYKHIYYRKTIF